MRYETFLLDDAAVAVIAYGTAARIAKGAIKRLREEGLKVGMIRPITLWPFPAKIIQETAKHLHDFFVFEMSTGQMVDDVKLALGVVELLVLYPGTPFGVAWNGGIAFTAGDYSFADKIYRKYLDDSEQYERLRNRDPKSDPLHPSHHFSALLATQK